MTRYVWVTARKAEGFPITASCDAAGVSCQAFYDWKRVLDAGSLSLITLLYVLSNLINLKQIRTARRWQEWGLL